MINYKNELQLLSDEKYRIFQSKLVPNVNNIMGVKIPKLRSFINKLSKNEKLDYINNYDCKYHEEILLKGLIICSIKDDIEKILSYTREYISLIDSWDTCDIFVSSFHITKLNKKEVYKFINKYIYSDKEFEKRFAIVMLLNYFVCDDYIDDIFNIIKYIKCNYYYDKMALAWLISILYINYKDRTLKYLNNCNLDIFTFNKSIQKIIESNRVSRKDKEFLKKFKIKV